MSGSQRGYVLFSVRWKNLSAILSAWKFSWCLGQEKHVADAGNRVDLTVLQ